jgi:histidinol-phosphate aminotransferase
MDLNRYSDADRESLRALLAHRWGLDPSRILLAAARMELLLACRIEGGPGRALVSGSSSSWIPFLEAMGYECRRVPLVREESSFRFDQEAFLDALSGYSPDLVLISGIDDPTGAAIPPETLRRIASLHRGLTVIDESYVEFSRHGSVLEGGELPEGTLVVRSFAHAWGLAGLNLVAAAVDPETARRALLFPITGPDGVASGIVAHVAAGYEEWMESRVYSIRYLRDALIRQANAVEGIRAVESEGNFVLIRLEEPAGNPRARLEAAGIQVAFVSIPGAESAIRATIGREGELQALLAALGGIEEERGAAVSCAVA